MKLRLRINQRGRMNGRHLVFLGSGQRAHGAHQFGFAGQLLIYPGDALEFEYARLHSLQRNVHHQLVARLNRTLKARTVNAG